MRRSRVELMAGLRAGVRRARARPVETAIRAGGALLLVLSVVAVLAPLYWLLSAAVRPPGSISVPPSVVPPRLTASNLVRVLADASFARYFANSVLVSAATVTLALAVATPAGYALARYDIRHRRPIMVAVLLVQMIPLLALVTPLYELFALVGLLDTLAVVVLTDTVLVAPVGVWLIKGYFETIPASLEEAARVGGATRTRAFLVVLPLARPAIAATAVFAFVVSWNQFVVPLTFTSSPAAWTFPVGLYEYISRRGVVNWPLLGAASLWAMVPLVVVVAAFQRHLVAGLTGGFGGG